jgi:predicted transcriptional regulator
MELEPMFTEQKWNILKCLSNEKLSPLQLAGSLNTTMANISQQLRLLEAANLVKKEKIKNRDKGKPRALFSLTDDYVYLVSAMNNFAEKRLFKVDNHHRIIMKIWFIQDEELQNATERVYWKIEHYIKSINLISVDEDKNSIYIVSDKKKEIERIADLDNLRIFSKEEAEKLIRLNKEPFSSAGNLTVIYDPESMLKK